MCTKNYTKHDLRNFERSRKFERESEHASNCKKFGEHKQAYFASKSSKGLILRALENFKGPFDTPNI